MSNVAQYGLPTVAYLAGQVCLSSNYVSDQLKQETGLSPQEHIHRYIIEEAKSRLLSTELSVSELSYSLGLSIPGTSRVYSKPRQDSLPSSIGRVWALHNSSTTPSGSLVIDLQSWEIFFY